MSGIYFPTVLARLGIADEMKSKIVTPDPGTPVGEVVARAARPRSACSRSASSSSGRRQSRSSALAGVAAEDHDVFGGRADGGRRSRTPPGRW